MTERAVAEALAGHLRVFGEVRIRAMFGDWLVYVDEVPAAAIGEGALYVKLAGVPVAEAEQLCGNAEQPYPGASGYARVDVARFSDPAWVEAVRVIRAAAPLRKPKKAKARSVPPGA